MRPNAPFNRLNCYPRTQIYVDPVIRICLQSREFKSRDCFAFGNTQLNLLIGRCREIGCQRDKSVRRAMWWIIVTSFDRATNAGERRFSRVSNQFPLMIWMLTEYMRMPKV